MEKFLITKENIKVLTDRFSKLIGNRYKNRWKDFNDTDRSNVNTGRFTIII